MLNALTGAGVLAEDKLFATLDLPQKNCPTEEVLRLDTVGL
ncbi:MAG: hypothetical protein ACLS48_03735 [[Eubacterium] siraeum]